MAKQSSDGFHLKFTIGKALWHEMFSVGLGADLSRLLPHELLSLRQPLFAAMSHRVLPKIDMPLELFRLLACGSGGPLRIAADCEPAFAPLSASTRSTL